MGIINQGIGCLSGCVIGCVNVFIFITLGSAALLSFKISQTVGIVFSTFAVLLILTLITVNVILNGILKAFSTTNWIIFYEELKKKNN